jgi:hypothetical protein
MILREPQSLLGAGATALRKEDEKSICQAGRQLDTHLAYGELVTI